MPCLRKVLISFLLCFSFVLSAENTEFEKPVLGKLIERNGFLYDTFYYSMDGEPQYLLQKYDEIAIPHSVNLNSLNGLEFNGIKISDMISEVTYDANNFRAFKIKLDEFDRKNWLQVRNILAKDGVAAWPVLTYHAINSPIVLDGTITVVFSKYTSVEEREKTLEIFGLKVVETDEDLNLYSVQLPAGTDPFAICNALFERRLVKWAQPNWMWHMIPLSTTPNDTYFSKQWHLKQINAPEAWDVETAANKDVRIAIVDTGVDLTHPDLNVLKNLGRDYIGKLGGAPHTTNNTYNDILNGVPHGTACAGLAAAKTNNGMGVSATCWGCPIIPIRLIGSQYEQPSSYTAYKDALKYAVDSGAWVVSNSWGANDCSKWNQDQSQCLSCATVPKDNQSIEAVDYGKTKGRNGKGTIFLWAAGNSHCNTNLNSFLKSDDLLVVSALENGDKLSGYSNYGAEIDISAGGGGLVSGMLSTTDIQGLSSGYACDNSQYCGNLDENGDYTNRMNGTSAATPVAAGAVALMLAANPDLSFDGAMKCIKSQARKPSTSCTEGSWTMQSDPYVTDGAKEHSPCFGFGIVDAHAMVVGAKEGSCGKCIATSSIDGCYGKYAGRDDDCDGEIDNKEECNNGGKGKAGDTCTTATDCINVGTNPKCITGEGYNGGYCSASCSTTADCYNGGKNKVECYKGQCIASCKFNDIRSGYACIGNKILPVGTEVEASCGNETKEEGEKCDGGYKSCELIDSSFTGGIAYCNSLCNGYDTSTCEGGGGNLCGNGNPDPGEVCDGDTLPCSQFASTPAFGTVKCSKDCLSWDKSDCHDENGNSGSEESGSSGNGGNSGNDNPNCGNGIVDHGEQCDDGNRTDGDGCSEYCMFEDDDPGSSKKLKSSGCSATLL